MNVNYVRSGSDSENFPRSPIYCIRAGQLSRVGEQEDEDMVKQAQFERRFEFGKNWVQFLRLVSDQRIEAAERSLLSTLELDSLAGMTFLDIGSGSGLFSLAARGLGAKVHSIDIDEDSVACARDLKRRFLPDDEQWTIEKASVLDRKYLESLGRFDIVYSWGVLHHTGAMWQAIENASQLVAHGGRLYIAIYNDQGGWSTRWKLIKKISNMLPRFLQPAFAVVVALPRETLHAVYMLAALKPGLYVRYWTHYQSIRGMSRWHDILGWIGGWPFEVAKPEQIFEFLKRQGFSLEKMTTVGGSLGCNQFVFVRLFHHTTNREL